MSMRSGTALPERLERALGIGLNDVRSTGAGQGRAFFATMAAAEVVVKWGIDPDLEEKIPYVAGLVKPLRDRRCRIPRILVHGALGGRAGAADWRGYAWVQERLPGAAITLLDEVLLSDLVDLITRLDRALPGAHRNDLGAWVPGVVLDDDAGWWRNARAMGKDAASFCDRLSTWIGRPTIDSYPAFGPGYVHCDMNLGNILVADGRLSGLVDAEHMGVGDRGIDAARLAVEWYRLASHGVTGLATGGLARLAEFGSEVSGSAGWRIAVGYELIGRLGWRSDTGAPPDPDALPVCAGFLDELSP
jgi:hypothetical protein